MKKFYTLVTAVLLCLPTFAQDAFTVPYSSTIAGPVDGIARYIEGWKSIDANGDNKTWGPQTDTKATEAGLSKYCAKYTYSDGYQADDYLVSPAIQFEAGTEYKVIYWYRAQSANYKESFEVYASTGDTPEAILAGKKLAEYPEVTNTAYQQGISDFTPTESGTYHITFHVTSPKGFYYLYIAGFSVVKNEFAPAAVKGLTATRGENRALTCTLEWTLPTTDVFGEPLPADKPIEKVEIFRDGGETAIATLAGTATSYIDTETTGLTSGYHTYTVTVTAGGVSTSASVGPTSYVGPIVPTPVPTTLAINSKDDLELWTITKGECTNTSNWEYSSDNCVRYSRSYNKSEDDWLISPPLQFTKAGAYQVNVDCKLGSNNEDYLLECYFGTSTDTGTMNLRLERLPMSTTRGVSTFYVNVTEPGTYYTALHAKFPGASSYQTYYIYGIAVDEAKIMPKPVTELTSTPVGQENKVKLSFFLSDKANTDVSIDADNVKVKVYRVADGTETLVKTIESSALTLGAVNETEVEVAAPGIYTFRVVTANAQDESSAAHPTVTTSWIGDRLVALPYSIDFSASQMTDDTINIWDIIDANADGKTWARQSYYGMRCAYPATVDGKQTYDDYLLSPYFELEAGNHIVTYKVSGAQANQEYYYNIGITQAGTYSATNKPVLTLSKRMTIANSSFETVTYTFTLETAGKYQFVFAANEENAPISYDYRCLSVKEFSIRAIDTLPDLATEITITPDPSKELKATVTWKNPTTTNIEGTLLANGDIVKALIYRDGELVGTVTEGLVPGETSSFVDADIPQAGLHAYTVEIYNAYGKSETAATPVVSPWIGAGMSTPYTADNYLAFSQWTTVNANNDTNSYGDPVTWILANGKDFVELTSTSKDADDWFISPIIDIKPQSIYKVEVRLRQSNASAYYCYESPLQLRVGTGDNYTDYAKAATFTLAKDATVGNEQTSVFYVRSASAAEAAAKVAKAAAEGEEGEGEGEEVDVEALASDIESGDVHFALRCYGRAALRLESVTITYVKEATGSGSTPGEHVCNGQALPYQSSLATSSSSITEGWTVKDGNDDNRTWSPVSDSDSKNGFAMKYTYHSSNDADDYLISPLFHFAAGKEYKVMYTFRSSSTSARERMRVYASESDVPAEIKDSYLLNTHENFAAKNQQGIGTFAPKSDVDAHIVLVACSDKDQYGIYVSEVTIIENVFAPKPVSDLTATVAPLRELKITLDWTLPTESIFNDPFTEEQKIEKIEIFRDGGETAVATYTEAVTTFVDTEATGLTPGKHTYDVTVTVAGATATANVGPTAYAGPVAPSPVPVTFLISDADEATLWTIVSEESSTTTTGWEYYFPSYGSYTPSFRLGYYMRDVVKDWLISPPIAISEAGYYRVTYKARNTDGESALTGCIGTSLDVQNFKAMSTQVLAKVDDEYSFDFYASEAGTYYAALLANIPSVSGSNSFYVTSLSVSTSEFVPAPVTDLTAAGDGEENAVVLKWKNPATDFGGQAVIADNYKLEIYRGEELVKTILGTALLTDGSFNTYRDEVPESGIYTYTLKTVTNAGVSAPVTVSATTKWVGSHVVALPYQVNFAEDDEANASKLIWEFVDANNDGKTWYEDTYAGITLEGVKDDTTTPASSVFGDYIVTPIFVLEPGYYCFSYELRGGSAASSWSAGVEIPYTVGCFKAGTFNNENTAYTAKVERTIAEPSYGDMYEFKFYVSEAGNYQIALGINAAIEYSYYYAKASARKFKMEQTLVLPAAATELAVVPAADKSLKATFTWTNPTATNVEGVQLAATDIVKAVIVRDGEAIAEVTEGLVPGETSSYVDETLTQAGPHTYSVDIYNANGKNQEESPSITSDWIGGALTVPYQASTAADFGLWNFVNIDNDTNTYGDPITWEVYKSSSNEYLHITCTSKVANDWAITPAIELEEATIYEVTIKSGFYSSYSAYDDQTLQIGASATGEYTDMQNIYTLEMDKQALLNSPKTDTFLLLTPGSEPEISTAAFDDYGDPVDEPTKVNITAGTKYFGIYSGARGEIIIRHFGITKKGSTTGVDGVFAKDGVVYVDGTLTFDGKADINIFNVAGTLVVTEHGVEKSFSLENLAGGVYMVSLTFENGKTTVLKVVK